MSSHPSPVSPDEFPVGIDARKALAALGNALRWEIFQLLADGSALNASAVARRFDRDFDGVSKHLRILRSAGLLRSRRAADKRVEKYFIPPEFRQTPGQVNLGFCLLRVPTARPDPLPDPAPRPFHDKDDDERFEDEEETGPIQGFGEMLVNSASRGSH